MAERKDYYKILGLTDDERKLKGKEFQDVIKKKFRKISIEKHPDKQHGKSDAEKKQAEEEFKEAALAYEVLSDEKKRMEYDNPHSSFDFGDVNFGDMDFDDILRNFGFGRSTRHKEVKGTSIRITLSLTLEEMANGVIKKIKYKRFVPCDNCNGSGRTANTKEKICRTCGGSGMVFSQNHFMMMQQTCPTCGGQGKYLENPCSACGGHGVVQKTSEETEIKVEKGVLGGMNFVLQGMGNYPPHGEGVPGDLIILVRQIEHDTFECLNTDLYFEIDITVVDAILGTKISVPTLDGKLLSATIPQGTKEGDKLRFKGYGMPKYGTNYVGDMIGVVKIEIPKQVTDEERHLLEQLREQEHFKSDD